MSEVPPPPLQSDREWLDDWLTTLEQEQERQTGYLRIMTIAVSALAVITLLVLGVTVCSTLGVYFLG
ncbi:MAG TPA: hypothetical protein VJ398_02190 [Acidimicrobiia bacterium]|nr:hypothetical protein [Acidimicrobiia bacterium]